MSSLTMITEPIDSSLPSASTSEAQASTTDLVELQGQLRNQMSEVAQLAGGLAHEIRNPISTMLLTLDLLAEEFQNPENPREQRVQKWIERVRRESQRLQQILEDFLRLARLKDLKLTPTDLNSIIDDLRDFWEPQAMLHGVVLRVYFDPTLPRTLLEENLLKQAILNLLLNAQQAMPQGGELILTTRRDDPWNIMEVIDTGAGIAPEMHHRVFEPFYSTKPGGTGLGLPMVRRIVESHGGTIQLQSEPGKGTRFTIRLRQVPPTIPTTVTVLPS